MVGFTSSDALTRVVSGPGFRIQPQCSLPVAGVPVSSRVSSKIDHSTVLGWPPGSRRTSPEARLDWVIQILSAIWNWLVALNQTVRVAIFYQSQSPEKRKQKTGSMDIPGS